MSGRWRVLWGALVLLALGCGGPTAVRKVRPVASPNLPAVTRAVQALIDRQEIAGGVVLAYHAGRIIHFGAYGLRDIRTGSPLAKDSIFRIYSMTKPITSVAVMMLVDEGRLALDDPIEKHLPSFAGVQVWEGGRRVAAKTKPTIRHLLTHSAGLTYGFFGDSAVDWMYKKAHPLFSKDNRAMVTKLARHPLRFHPGERWHYSMATDVLGHVIERVSGRSLGAFLAARIFEPLGMKDTAFFIKADQLERFASYYGPKLKVHERYDKSPYRKKHRLQSGGGGLVSTAPDYLKFCRLLLDDGRFEGRRLLSKRAVEAIRRNQLPKGVLAYGVLGFGLGVAVHLRDRGAKAHRGEYGWSGIASTHFWISPSDDLVVIALTQRHPFSGILKDAVKPLIYRAIAQ